MKIGVLGASSLVGPELFSLLVGNGYDVVAVTRRPGTINASDAVRCLTPEQLTSGCSLEESVEIWISLLPIWILTEYLPVLQKLGGRRIVVLSSTSAITKRAACSDQEKDLARKISAAEADVLSWARAHQIAVVILATTMIYGSGRDKNISLLAKFIHSWGFSPVVGKGCGLRQPVHIRDVAQAVLSALNRSGLKDYYILSGGEALSYRDMVKRIFEALHRTPRFVSVPLPIFHIARRAAGLIGLNIPIGAGDRMNQDLHFSHAEAQKDLDFRPQKFIMKEEDLPS